MQSGGVSRQEVVLALFKTLAHILYLSFYSASKLQIQSIEPNCGSVLGGSVIKLYMPIAEKILDYVENITVGFKNNRVSQEIQNGKEAKT